MMDRLAPEAVQSVAAKIRQDPEIDILYSDRDMISIHDNRFMYLMKPDWSPETLFSGNYIFHLMCYRKQLVTDAGGLRPEFDGSQDYDLISPLHGTNLENSAYPQGALPLGVSMNNPLP